MPVKVLSAPPTAPAGTLDAFAGLCRACGLPAPAVRLETSEDVYRRSAAFLEGGAPGRLHVLPSPVGCALLAVLVLGVPGCAETAVFGVDVEGSWRDGWDRLNDASACVVFVSAAGVLHPLFRREAARRRAEAVPAPFGLEGPVRATPHGLALRLSPDLAGGVPNAGTAAAMRGGGLRGLLALAATAGELVDEAILMDGFVLALAPLLEEPGVRQAGGAATGPDTGQAG